METPRGSTGRDTIPSPHAPPPCNAAGWPHRGGVGHSHVTLATAASATMTQQFWFRCAHPRAPISAKGPEVLPAASHELACPHRRQNAPPAPHFCKPRQAAIGPCSCVWEWRRLLGCPRVASGPPAHRNLSPFLPPGPQDPAPASSRDRKGLVAKHTQQKPARVGLTGQPWPLRARARPRWAA